MANLLFEGFELFTSLNVAARATSSAGSWQAQTSVTRVSGGQCMNVSGTSGTYGRTLSATSTGHVFAGVAYIPVGGWKTSANCNVILYDGATAQIGWRANSDGSISVYRGGTNASILIGTTATGILTLGSTSPDFKMIELDVVLATGATGSVNLYVADVLVLTVNSVQTTNSGAAQVTKMELFGQLQSSGTINEDYDDMYFNDDSGSAPENARFGEAFCVEKQVPNAAGNYSEWTKGGSIGANNFNQVDDYGTASDTDYVTSATLNQRDTYGCADLLTASGTVVGFEHNMVARKDDVATRQVTPMYRTASADFLGTAVSMTGSYVTLLERKMTNPNTGVHWSIAEINALEHGVKLTT